MVLQELDLSHNQLVVLPSGLSQLTALTALQVQHNQLSALPAELTAATSIRLLDASHNWLSGLQASPDLLARLTCSWKRLEVLKLENVSDKRGRLLLPAELAQCVHLRELAVGHNFKLDWQSLEVVEHCKVRGAWHCCRLRQQQNQC